MTQSGEQASGRSPPDIGLFQQMPIVLLMLVASLTACHGVRRYVVDDDGPESERPCNEVGGPGATPGSLECEQDVERAGQAIGTVSSSLGVPFIPSR